MLFNLVQLYMVRFGWGVGVACGGLSDIRNLILAAFGIISVKACVMSFILIDYAQSAMCFEWNTFNLTMQA
jgi:hypothetical protein